MMEMAKKNRPDWKFKLSAEVDRTAQGLMHMVLRDWHPRLVDKEISVLFKPTGANQSSPATPRERKIAKVDGFVILALDWWEKADDKAKETQMDCLLALLAPAKSGGLTREKPDFVGTLAVVERRGAYNLALEQVFAKAQQLELNLGKATDLAGDEAFLAAAPDITSESRKVPVKRGKATAEPELVAVAG